MRRGKAKKTIIIAIIVAGLFIAYEANAMSGNKSPSNGATVIDSETYETNVVNVFSASKSNPGNCRNHSCK